MENLTADKFTFTAAERTLLDYLAVISETVIGPGGFCIEDMARRGIDETDTRPAVARLSRDGLIGLNDDGSGDVHCWCVWIDANRPSVSYFVESERKPVQRGKTGAAR